MVACGGGVSEEELQAVQGDLQVAQAQTLEAEKSDLETKVRELTLEDIGVVVTINELMAFPPTVVELKPSSASIQMVTKLPTTCSIAHDLTTDYGQISVDDSMSRGGHTDHYHTLRGLQPDTVYHYKWGLLGPDGTVYASTDLTFNTRLRAPALRHSVAGAFRLGQVNASGLYLLTPSSHAERGPWGEAHRVLSSARGEGARG